MESCDKMEDCDKMTGIDEQFSWNTCLRWMDATGLRNTYQGAEEREFLLNYILYFSASKRMNDPYISIRGSMLVMT